MGAVTKQFDYVTLTDNEVQEALKIFIRTLYNREPRGRVHIDMDYDRIGIKNSVSARCDLEKD